VIVSRPHEIEYVGRACLDRHGFGGDDIVDRGLGDHVLDRAAQIGIIDDMRFGAANVGGKARPLRPGPRKM
jgi:hypothetical protein